MNIPHKKIQTRLTKGLLDLIILQSLNSHPMHGYELMLTIRKIYGVAFGASTIYPILNAMEKKNFIKYQWDMNGERPRKIYSLTGEGKNLLDYTTGSLRTICRTIGTETNHTNEQHIQFKVEQTTKNKEPYHLETKTT